MLVKKNDDYSLYFLTLGNQQIPERTNYIKLFRREGLE